jgi:hypothetical protein
MTIQKLITKYAGLVHRQSAAELKANPVFMRACRENEGFKLWVLGRKPTMATVSLPSVKFKRPDDIIVPAEAKSPQSAPEPVEKVSNAVQLYREVIEYGRKQGFIKLKEIE